MRMRQQQNRGRCETSKAEQWMRDKLLATGRRWTRQAQSGYRLFDFWNAQIGVAVEVDGPEHNLAEDSLRDQWALTHRGILVLRVRNFNESDAAAALAAIAVSESWNARRAGLGLKPIKE